MLRKVENSWTIFKWLNQNQFQIGYLKVDQIDVAANEKYNQVNVSINNDDPEKTLINYHSELTSEVPIQRAKVGDSSGWTCDTLSILFQMLIILKNSAETPKSEKLFRCGTDLLKTYIDVCRMGEIQSSTFAKVLMQNFARSSNFDIKCPLKPKNYTLENFSWACVDLPVILRVVSHNYNYFSITDEFLLRFPKEQKICLDLTLSVSLKNKGKLEVMWRLKAWIRFKKDFFTP